MFIDWRRTESPRSRGATSARHRFRSSGASSGIFTVFYKYLAPMEPKPRSLAQVIRFQRSVSNHINRCCKERRLSRNSWELPKRLLFAVSTSIIFGDSLTGSKHGQTINPTPFSQRSPSPRT